MTMLSPVVWKEGMHLAQHHFQAQSRYFEDLAAFTLSSLYFKAYGFAACELDDEALLNGSVAVRHARGIMPDGLPFQFGGGRSAPPPLSIQDRLSPTQTSLLVVLAVPSFTAGGSATSPVDSDRRARFVTSAIPIADEVTGQDPKQVTVGRANFRFETESETGTNAVTLPIARVRRDGSGRFVYDPTFIPPCLQLAASRRLADLTQQLLDKLESKSKALANERAGAAGDLADFAAREIAGFWLSHAVNTAIAPLRHLLSVGTTHPEELYLELARLAGALCTFSLDADPRVLPPYNHDDLDSCFGPLELQIRRLLDVWFSNRVVTYPLEVTEPPVHAADITDPRCLHRSSRWFLEVRSSAGQAQVATRVPELVKVCSADAVLKLVQRQLPGLTIDYLALPPAELSPRVGSHYFTLETAGQGAKNPCMILIQKTQRVGVFVPDAIPDAKLALLILLEE